MDNAKSSENFINGQEKAGFINGQGRAEYANIHYGRSTVGRSGCEAIACYNAMLLLGKPMPFSEIRDYFEQLFRRGLGWLGMGFLGASPLEIRLFLRKRRVRFRTVRSLRHFRRILAEQGSEGGRGVLIVSYWNKPLFKYGYHTVAVDCRMGGGKTDSCQAGSSSGSQTDSSSGGPEFTVYNRYNQSTGPERISDVSELMHGRLRFIRGFYLYNQAIGQGSVLQKWCNAAEKMLY